MRLQYEKMQYSNYMMKILPGDQKSVQITWVFEICEFELTEFSYKGLLVNSEGTGESVRITWFFDL